MNKLTHLKHYRKEYVKALYGKLGKDSGLKPGVAYPRKEELEHLKQYEKAFCPKLEDLIAENKAKKDEYQMQRQMREEEVYRNLQKLPQEFEAFFEKIRKKEDERRAWLVKREARIEEVREVLGFRAKPTDDRFLKALAEREEAEAKARKKEMRLKRENAPLEDLLKKT